ncbi:MULTISPECIES: response regulator transcription factor [unclassified Gemella]|uniref:response regulator transcription factor n=1 Tax=unclassified Gemella TaxID=2624949 RepID=UPI001C03D52F|nr:MULTISPECIES: response regulator transcription factor [unclassified Gemella]MBU0279326.1 response regulator transcription factor [Gemella sp. zg-1178]QWQ38599.1 response regulator transcription factor [Gemella sp. zg-570]
MNKTILLVDDEIEIKEINRRYLTQEGYTVKIANNGLEALEIFKKEEISLIITDIMMPLMDGYDLISQVQKISPDQPFLFITAKTSDMDKIYSLSIGADDFISKPFSPRELVLRVNNILRRINGNKETKKNKDYLQIGDLKINSRTRQAFIEEKELSLTNKEFDLLWIFISNPKKVFSKTELYDNIWNEEYIDDTNTLNVHIHGLRSAISKHSTEKTPTIKTVWGLGYKLEVQV